MPAYLVDGLQAQRSRMVSSVQHFFDGCIELPNMIAMFVSGKAYIFSLVGRKV